MTVRQDGLEMTLTQDTCPPMKENHRNLNAVFFCGLSRPHQQKLLMKSCFCGTSSSRSHFGYNTFGRVPMRQISLREFRTRGSKALEAVPQGETILLSGQQGPAYFLVPVLGDVVMEDRELRRAMAKASLRESWVHAKASGLDEVNDEEIEQEIKQVRRLRKRRKTR
jgi:antitoxin (DNA-binding transcriptional repressor) of toxin-antitoxin stability system